MIEINKQSSGQIFSVAYVNKNGFKFKEWGNNRPSYKKLDNATGYTQLFIKQKMSGFLHARHNRQMLPHSFNKVVGKDDYS